MSSVILAIFYGYLNGSSLMYDYNIMCKREGSAVPGEIDDEAERERKT